MERGPTEGGGTERGVIGPGVTARIDGVDGTRIGGTDGGTEVRTAGGTERGTGGGAARAGGAGGLGGVLSPATGCR